MTQPGNGQDKPFVPQSQGLRATRKEAAANKKAAAKKAAQTKAQNDNVVQIGANKKAAAKKAPAKKAAAKVAAPPAEKRQQDSDHPWYTRKSYTAVPGQKLYEAVGESGQIAVRSCANVVTHAISWAHTGQPGERAKAIREGVIANFYPTEDAAKKAAEKFAADNPEDRIVVVPAREYRGQ
jgi:hypothetical protein